MPWFGSKKTRTSRTATLKPSSGFSRWIDRTFRNRDSLLRLGLLFVALLLLLPALEAWRTPFPYRLGDWVAHGVMAKVDFDRQNLTLTEQARGQAELAVFPIFVQDPEPIRTLPVTFRLQLADIAQADSVDDLSPQTRTLFGLTMPDEMPLTDSPHGDMHTRFSILKALVAAEDSTEGKRIDKLTAEFSAFIAPMIKLGLADPNELTEIGIRPDTRVNVVLQSDSESPQVVYPADIQLSELLEETGLLGKSWQTFSEPTMRPFIERWLRSQAPITLTYDRDATKRARSAARAVTPPVFDKYSRDDVLVEPGQVINAEQLSLLEAEYETLDNLAGLHERLVRIATILILLGVLAVLITYYLARNESRLLSNLPQLALFLGTIILTVALGRLLSFDPWRAELIPLIAAVIVFTIAYNQVLATLMAVALCLVITVATRSSLQQFVVLLSVSAVCIVSLSQVASRSTVIKVGFFAGLVYFFVSVCMESISRQLFADAWADPNLYINALRGAGWCLAAGYLVAGSLPFIESAFGVVTDISLLEMSDVSHPLLQELVQRAPGTYNHSMTVASIGEAAADAIGANGLLVRVGAYFHDIGKMLKPSYFIENNRKGTANKHDRLNPAMSALIIIGHVKDGADLARQHNLPEQLVDFIEQHHGTTLVEFFFRVAKDRADEEHRTDADESRFRYPGPKPQTREAGVMMLADAVESASRTLSEPTPASIENLVHKISMKKLMDGQFDESSLTLTEISTVEDSLIKSLIGIYHGRIKYPEQRTIPA